MPLYVSFTFFVSERGTSSGWQKKVNDTYKDKDICSILQHLPTVVLRLIVVNKVLVTMLVIIFIIIWNNLRHILYSILSDILFDLAISFIITINGSLISKSQVVIIELVIMSLHALLILLIFLIFSLYFSLILVAPHLHHFSP